MQKVLAASGDFNFFTFWQGFNWASISGEPNEPTGQRIAEAEEFCRWFDERSPQAKLGHSFEALEPEEDEPLSEGCFVTPSFVGYAEVPGYGRWLGEQPAGVRFEFLRAVMQYMQWQGLARADRPWLLKSPAYGSQELEILEVFPDARFVMAHRSPLRTVPSTCTLVGHFRRAYGTSTPDPIAPDGARRRQHGGSDRHPPGAPGPPHAGRAVRRHRRRPVTRWSERVYAPCGHDAERRGRADDMLRWDEQQRHAQARDVRVLARRDRSGRGHHPRPDAQLLRAARSARRRT